MPLDPHASRLLAILKSARRPDPDSTGPAEWRQAFAALMRLSGAPERVSFVEERFLPANLGALALRLYTPRGLDYALGPGLVYFHGGGFIAGSLETHDAFCRSLANAGGCRVVAVDYRVAPEHKFPTALLDCYRAASWVKAHASMLGIDRHRLAVGGDSAGASLAAIVCGMARAAPGPPFALQLLICPITDFAASQASRRALATGYLLEQRAMERELALYLPAGFNMADPGLSPLHLAELGGLPPACIHTAEFDPLRDEGEAYAERLKEAGVAVRHTCHSGMIHLFYAMGGAIPYARRALAAIGEEIRMALAPTRCG